MKSYNTEWIRNVGIVGHGDTGKTQLVSSLLFTAGMTPRLGKVSEGSTTTDWDEEEIARKISINTGLAYAEWQAPGQAEKTKINFLDTPGYSTFINETKSSLIAADASLIVVDAAAGVQVVTEKVWDYATEYDQPRAFVLNWMDRELASFERALDSLQQVFGRGAVPIQLPIGAEKSFRGVVDLVTMKALVYTPDGDGKAKIEEIPADLAEEAKAAHEALVEMVAEGDDALMQEFFEKGTLPVEDLKKGLREAVRDRRIFPVLLSSALHNIGSDAILNFMAEIFPSPAARKSGERHKTPDHKGETVERKIADSEPVSLLCFQDAGRSVRRAHHVFQGDVRRAEKRRHAAEFQPQLAGAPAARAGDAGKNGFGGDRTARRRYRRGGQVEGHDHRRNAGRQERADFLSAGARFRSPRSRLRSSRRRAPTKTASAWRFTKFWKRIWRCVLRAIRKRRNFC